MKQRSKILTSTQGTLAKLPAGTQLRTDFVATVPAKLAQGNSGRNADAITIRSVSNVKTLDQVDFAGGKRSLVFGEATGTQSPSGRE